MQPEANPILKVCFIQPIQSPYWTERLRELTKLTGFDLTLILENRTLAHRPGWSPDPIDGINILCLNSIALPSVGRGDDLGYTIRGVRSVPWQLARVLFKLKPDVVVVCNATQVLFALPVRFILRNKLALIVEDTPHATRHLSFFARVIKQIMYRSVDCCFAFSEDARRFLASNGITKTVKRSSWSINMQEFRPAAACSCEDHGQCKMVIFVGALVEAKGVRLLLDSWTQLPENMKRNTRLLLVGSGPLRGELEARLSRGMMTEVEMAGQIPYQDVRSLMQKATLLVLPTLKDLFSLTVLEGMACGCPVITTPFNGARELVDEGVNGWIVDPTQPGALRRALETALSKDPSDLRLMGRAARARVEHMDNTLVMLEFAQSLRGISAVCSG